MRFALPQVHWDRMTEKLDHSSRGRIRCAYYAMMQF